MDELPTKYDVIVIGTGMTGSIVAAAFSRIGKAVLHIDENDYYSEDWASFNLNTIESWLNRMKCPRNPLTPNSLPSLNSTEKLIPFTRYSFCRNIEQKWSCPAAETKVDVERDAVEPDAIGEVGPDYDKADNSTEPEVTIDTNAGEKDSDEWTVEKLESEFRKFNLDICPKLLYSRGPLVELLISSNIARYADFKSVTRVLTWRDNQLEVVPSSRADVFATKQVTVVQKRMLVKILTVFADYPATKEEFEGYEDKTLKEYLQHKKCPDQLIHYIVYAIAMGSDSTGCIQGVLACQRFLLSLGRYGNTPFIFPLYGSGELPQCFCRLCAVFGGVYHLNRPVDGFIVNEEGAAVAIVTGGQRIEAAEFVVSSAVCPSEFVSADTSPVISRGIYITDRSIAASEREAITLLQFPPDKDHGHPVTVFEVGNSCHVSPKGLFLVHMTTDNGSHDHVTSALFGDGAEDLEARPKVLWSLKWQSTRGSQTATQKCPSNLKVFCGPDPGLDYDVEVERAKEIFHELCPDEEFLPRAPDPEEIILGDPEQEETDHSDALLAANKEAEEADNVADSVANSGDSSTDAEKTGVTKD